MPAASRVSDKTPGFAEILQRMLEAAQTGRLLMTCRYPVPDADLLLRVDLPALSPGELRRLFLRLPALRALALEDRRLITRTIGGHPRLIEFVDVLIRDRGSATFAHVTRKLRDLARDAQLDVTSPRSVEVGVAQAVLLGSRDIVLDVLVEDLTPEQRELLFQAAVSSAAFSSDDLTYANHGQDITAEQSRSTVPDIERLRDLTLLSPAPGGELLVHPWIASALRHGHTDEDLVQRHRRAAANAPAPAEHRARWLRRPRRTHLPLRRLPRVRRGGLRRLPGMRSRGWGGRDLGVARRIRASHPHRPR